MSLEGLSRLGVARQSGRLVLLLEELTVSEDFVRHLMEALEKLSALIEMLSEGKD